MQVETFIGQEEKRPTTLPNGMAAFGPPWGAGLITRSMHWRATTRGTCLSEEASCAPEQTIHSSSPKRTLATAYRAASSAVRHFHSSKDSVAFLETPPSARLIAFNIRLRWCRLVGRI